MADDVPTAPGKLSPLLKERLKQEDLYTLKILLKTRGVHTLGNLLGISTNDRAVLLIKARDLYDLLTIFPGSLHNCLNKLYGNDEDPGGAIRIMNSTSPMPLQPGSVGNKTMSATSPAFFPLGSGNSGNSSSWCSAAAGPRPAGPRPAGATVPSPQREEQLPVAADDDTELKKTMGALLEGARNVVGNDRYRIALKHHIRSNELAVAAALEAAQALAALTIRDPLLSRDKEKKEQLKAAKKVTRDALQWRVVSVVLGLDSQAALVRGHAAATRNTNCDENTVSQLTNGYLRLMKTISGAPPAKQRQVAASPERVRDPGIQGTARRAPSRNGSRAPGAQVREPPGLERANSVDPFKINSGKSIGSVLVRSNSIMNRRFGRCSGAEKAPYKSNATVGEEKAPDAASLEPPKVHGHLANVLAMATLKELDNPSISVEDCVQCALWLAELLDFSKNDNDFKSEIIIQAQQHLVAAAQREGLDEKSLRQVFRSLARVAGLDLMCLECHELCADGDAASEAGSGKQATFVRMLAETWAWLLVDGQDGQRLQLKAAENQESLKTLVNSTMNLLLRTSCNSIIHDVARDCCSALGALGPAVEDMQCKLKIAEWLLDTVESFQGHECVGEEGLSALLTMCRERKALFGMELSPESCCKIKAAAPELLAQHVKDRVMGQALTRDSSKDMPKDMFVSLGKLLVRTHTLDQVLRFICKSSHQPWNGEMLFSVLDEVNSSLQPAILDWIKNVAMNRAGDGLAHTILGIVLRSDGLGINALDWLVEPYDDADQVYDSFGLQLLVDWANKGRSSKLDRKERFFLVGFLFGATSLLQIITVCGNEAIFASVCGALLTLEYARPLMGSEKLKFARCLLKIPTPSTTASCTSWVKLVSFSLEGWLRTEEDSTDRQLAERASQKIASAIDNVLGCAGWSAFVNEAILALQNLGCASANGQLAVVFAELLQRVKAARFAELLQQ
jgi:hypothetical protein